MLFGGLFELEAVPGLGVENGKIELGSGVGVIGGNMYWIALNSQTLEFDYNVMTLLRLKVALRLQSKKGRGARGGV